MLNDPRLKSRRIYADWAATSHPKAPGLAEAVAHELSLQFSAGRGGYVESLEAQERIARTRAKVAAIVGVADASRIVFTAGTTDALNMIIQGVAGRAMRKRGACRVVACRHDHSAALLPAMLMQQRGAELTFIQPGNNYVIDPDDVRKALSQHTDLVVMPAVSNVTGAAQPTEAISQICREQGVKLLVDAAQAAGHMDLRWIGGPHGPTYVALSAHKGLLGIAGIGMAYVAPGAEEDVDPWRVGGTGNISNSVDKLMLASPMPMRFEAGTANIIAIAALGAALDYVISLGIENIAIHERDLCEQMLTLLPKSYTLHGPNSANSRTPIFSITHPAFSPEVLAAILDSQFGVMARSGLLCAPLALAGVNDKEGVPVCRLSFGALSTLEDVKAVCGSLAAITS